jgi:uncharacterized membrane protein YsdA (DUF1294 family)
LVVIIRIIGAALLLLLVLAAVLLGLAPLWVLVAYLMLGLVSFGVYGFDKRAARRGDWRVTEASLHGIDLIGGIAGGLLSQALFRHKTRKPGFVALTAAIAFAHLAALGTLAFGLWRLPAFLLAL